LEVTLSGPLNSVFKNKDDEEAFPFTLKANGKETPIIVSVRGNSRKRVCSFPPIKLDFDKSTDQDGPFAGQKSLKLVTHCNKSKLAQDNLLEEYAAYRFFSLISDAAYRVRLLKIKYEDTEQKQSTEKPAFIIESTRELVRRIDAKQVDVPLVSLKRLDKQQEALVYVFQYLVGNTDWSLVTSEGKDFCCHNGRLISKNNKLLYVPYDFDLSGVVDAHYAKPDSSMRIKKVTQRKYRGFCMERPVLAAALEEVASQESAMLGIIENLPELSAKAKTKNLRFLERFFEEAGDRQEMLDDFERDCLELDSWN
jgi:hypothetical protein